MSNPNALLLLADHIKLSLLERQRAKTLKLSSDSQDGHISRSLDQFREGLEALEKEQSRLQEAGDEAKSSALTSTLTTLQKQYHDLSSQFHGFPTPATSTTLTSPNDPSLAADFAHAQSSTSSNPPTSPRQKPTRKVSTPKTVRFSDSPLDLEAQNPPPGASSQNNQNPLFPYRDDPDTAGYRDQAANLDNVQIHEYHQRILEEQDAQLDALGASISRQRELSMRIGDELDEQVLMLDESERVVDRHASTLGRARRQVDRFARSASESRQMVAIVVLIIILVLLIAILK
ncbi:hypothetical protein QBC34DRAFT_490192 [Podospora aff. communis PSN243]|uniref:t-SNARE coiled-coil homology domain-containing protein n=1 Tax=Podospora aff. communis PSN243 TaxID=3040156 RepID=A0AAV9H4C1_9PEZI|nr:hypothetical protein QBC34DRAFT_490192 [Podospora aff. communis PSN243]